MAETAESMGIKIGRRTFLGALFLLLAIMVLAGILTQVIPQGAYEYRDIDGRSEVVPGSYRVIEGEKALPIWRWFTAPLEIFVQPKAVVAVTIMLFIMFLVGSFGVLEKSGIIAFLISGVIKRFGRKKYRLLAFMVLVCMILGSVLGMLEETITLVPITVALSLMLGWDSLVGVGMSILAVNLGFSTATFNPFTVGLAQTLAELPVFSGLLFRFAVFAITYALAVFFLIGYAKKIEAHPESSLMYDRDTALRGHYRETFGVREEGGPGKKKGLVFFAGILALVFCYVIAGFFISSLSTYVMPVMALLFTLGALAAGRITGLRGIGKIFFKGLISVLPSVLLILLAMSVTHIMEQGRIIDTILYNIYIRIETLGPYAGIIALYLLVLLLEFFIAGASAKAFLLIPVIIPLCDLIGITRQSAVEAFVLGDGFTNMLYPTNVLLILTLGIANIPYNRWFRWIWKPLLLLLLISGIALLAAVSMGYGPY
jgi:uncharacterized ion transporter superfamily protein YfcC